jgi:hypothetical protein
VAQDEFEIQLGQCKSWLACIRDNNGDILRLKDRLISNSRPEKEACKTRIMQN